MIDESSEIATPALPDLIRLMITSLTLHDVYVRETACDHAGELTDRLAGFEGAAGCEAVVFAVVGAEDLHGTWSPWFGAVEVGEAFAGV